MALPDFNDKGDLPEGVHQATIDEVTEKFSTGTPQRQLVTKNLLKIYQLAESTGKLKRLIIFGSYITTKPNPNDVDVVLVFMMILIMLLVMKIQKNYWITIWHRKILKRVSFGFVLLCSLVRH